jgi:UrcA family protein
MNIAVAKLPSTMVLGLALAVGGATSIARAQNPGESVMLAKTAVNYADLNLDSPVGAMTLYRRLKDASRSVCRELESMLVYLPAGFSGCLEASLGHAVHDVNRVSLTRAYLGEHGAAIAAKYDIEDPLRYAAK